MIDKISCVISCYNEKKNIPKLLNFIKRLNLEKKINFIIVNNGSTDNSTFIMRAFAKRYKNINFINLQKSPGWGAGIVHGLKLTRTRIVGWTHGDLEYQMDDLKKVLKVINSKSIFYNNKKNFFIKGSRVNRPLGKKLISKAMSLACSTILGKRLVEINAQPFFFHKKEFNNWKKIPKDLSLDLFAYEKVQRKNYVSTRIGVEQRVRIHGVSSWNNGFLSKFYLIMAFLRRAVIILLCRYS